MAVRVIQVNLDESGYGQTGPHEAFLFAGYAAPVKYMEDFTHRWDSILREKPAMTVHELKNRVRSRQKTDPRVLRMINAIGDSSLRGVRFKIAGDDYQKMLRVVAADKLLPIPPPRLVADNPYFFAFTALLIHLVSGAGEDATVKFEIIYDENLTERKKMERGYKLFYDHLRASHPELLRMIAKDPIPRNDEEFSPLQAADALAWHSHRHHVERSNGRKYISEIWGALMKIPFLVDESWNHEKLLDITIPSH